MDESISVYIDGKKVCNAESFKLIKGISGVPPVLKIWKQTGDK